MRIGIDCDGVLRNFIPNIIESIKENHPEFAKEILTPLKWDWESWLPFWTEEETEKYVFEDNFLDLFGIECPAIKSSLEDWPLLKKWANENKHELVLISAQRDHCIEPTNAWLDKYGFNFNEKHYTKNKHLVDVDILIDDSPAKLEMFKNESINNGSPICFKQSWNKKSQKSIMSINRLSEIISRVFG